MIESALENYKEKDDYKGFMAGHRYLLPMRTYFRDSYYTVLPMYNGQTDKVRNQIITLCNGIPSNNTCPSAVNSDYSAFWDEHFDSPSFFVIMLYDYVKNTGDISLLSEQIGSSTILEKAEAILLKLSESEDETGLTDFGVMTVYPFYKKATSAYRKSSEPLNYHNGANWPYLSAIYAYAKRQYGMEYNNGRRIKYWFLGLAII